MAREAEEFLGNAVESMALTGRGFDRALKVARTIADLEQADRVYAGHMAEALTYRDGFGGEGLAHAS
jgi:magnesium chelatase family protein